MAEWISVYGRRPVALSADAIHRELVTADLWSEAELLGLPEDEADAAVESALRHLRVDTMTDRGVIEVRWKPDGRPLQIHGGTGPEARHQVAETLAEHLPSAAASPGLAHVRGQLQRTRQVVNLELGGGDARRMGAVIGGVLAFSLAEASEGLVCFFDHDWVAPKDRSVTLWAPDD